MQEYELMKRQVLKGWNTWDTRSVLSHVHLPEGFAINICLKDNGKSAYLKEADVGNKQPWDAHVFPGPHAYDGSYTQLRMNWYDTDIMVTTAVHDDEQMILVEPIKLPRRPISLVVETGILWSRPGKLIQQEKSIKAEFENRTFEVFSSSNLGWDPYILTQAPYLVMQLTGPVCISTGKRRTVDEAKEIIAKYAARHKERTKKYGGLEEAYKAMQTCMAWDTVYDPLKDRLISPVSRRWNKNWGGYVMFCWDNYFAAQIASVESREVAYANLIEITKEKTESGFVPNVASAIGVSSRDRSQPPVGAASLLAVYKKWQEKWVIEMIFDDLVAWNDWWFEHRQIEPGLFAWGSDPYESRLDHYCEFDGVNDRLGAALESGLDNSPMYDGIPFDDDRHMLKLIDVGLTGLVIMDCRALKELAGTIGNEEVKRKMEERLVLCEPAIQKLWCEEDGFFYNLRTDTGEFNKHISPTNFYALYSSSVTKEQCRRVIDEHFYNSEEYWGDYILPSIARNDPAYPEQEYWRGRIWAPMNFLTYGALTAQGLDQPTHDLAVRSRNLLLKEWLEKGHVHENYCADTGAGCNSNSSDAFYHWGGLLGLIALREAGQA